MYSNKIDKVCGLCVHAFAVKGTQTHVGCKKRGGYVPRSRDACGEFAYDIFKRPVRRRSGDMSSGFSPEDFKL